MSMDDPQFSAIEDRCRAYAKALQLLDDTLEPVRRERREAVRRRMRSIKSRVADVAEQRARLKEAIRSHPDLFERPKTRSAHGVVVGLRKQPGRVEISDQARTLERITKVLPDRYDELVQVKRTLSKAALRRLDAAALAKIGVRVVAVDDEVVVKTAADDVDRVVEGLLADGEEP